MSKTIQKKQCQETLAEYSSFQKMRVYNSAYLPSLGNEDGKQEQFSIKL